MNTTLETRNESFAKIRSSIGPRHQEIITALERNGALTAWELSLLLNRMIHTVRPRLTELKALAKVTTNGTRYYERTDRNEAVWQLA